MFGRMCAVLSRSVGSAQTKTKKQEVAMKACCLCLAGVAAFAAARAEHVGKFESVGKAVAAFATNSPAVREAAYRYVVDSVRTADEKGIRPALQAARTMAVSLGRINEYEEVCAAGLASGSEPVRFASVQALLQAMTLVADPSKPVAQAERVLRDPGLLVPAHRVELARTVADVKCQRLADAPGALGVIDEALRWAEADRPSALQLRLKRVEVLRSAKMDDELEKEARALLADGECPAQARVVASFALADLAVRRKDAKRAGEIFLDAIREADPVPVGVAARLVAANVDEQTLDAAVAALRARLAKMPLDDATAFRAAVERVQPEVVTLLNHMGRCDEALAECRVLVLLASPKGYQEAVNLTAAALKRADGNLGRATAFMNFQKKGFVPKERNIVMDAPPLRDGVRAEARKSLPVGRSERWEECLAVAARLIWMDDPLAAVQEAMRAFALAPFEEKTLQVCADAVVQPILTVTRDPDAAKGVVDYLMYGPDGPDGAKGTQDDLSSPFENLEPVLKLGHGN